MGKPNFRFGCMSLKKQYSSIPFVNRSAVLLIILRFAFPAVLQFVARRDINLCSYDRRHNRSVQVVGYADHSPASSDIPSAA